MASFSVFMREEKPIKLDDKDRTIIQELIANSKLTTGRLSKKLLLPVTTIHNRIKKLESSGIILNYTVNLNYKKLGRPILANIGVSIDYKIEGKKISQYDIAKKIKAIDGVSEVSIMAGGTDILVKVLAKDIDDLNDLVTNRLRNIPCVDKTQTMIVLQQV
ncbi:Lrp/AsnC family transcriptional regulator [Candidatus Woesearchaeota archaeon]|nr:Lrp/AsnC family transcriptional regulator [Candidatus Woesearchaeota archaeon]